MIKNAVKSIHKGLSLTSLLLNGGIASHWALNKFSREGLALIKKQIEDLNAQLPQNGLIGDLRAKISELHWDRLEFPGELSFSLENICKSGTAGLLELRFSDSIFPQATHFGIVYPVLVLAYGDNWDTDGKLAMGLGAVGAFETLYWWMDCGKEDYCPEHH